jgi:predicted anti-sigma-YlaC factor YlaD
MFELMPVSLEFLRGVLGILCIFFAHMAGRVLVDLRKGRVRQSRLIAWVLRTAACAVAVIFPRRAADAMAILVWIVAAAAFAAGMWTASRARKEEDLTKTIFPDEP